MYKIFKSQVNLRSRKHSSNAAKNKETKTGAVHPVEVAPVAPQKKKEHNDEDTAKTDSKNYNESRDQVHFLPVKLKRSLSRDSYSTFTTAAETPIDGGSYNMSEIIIWGDLPMPSEIIVCGGMPKRIDSRKRLVRAHQLREPSIQEKKKEESDNDGHDDVEKESTFLPKTMRSKRKPEFKTHPSKTQPSKPQPSKSHCDCESVAGSRQRCHSDGDSEYLEAPPRWTRFEI